MTPISVVVLVNEVKKDYTFSSGLIVPKGSYVGTSLHSVHNDENLYADAQEFKPWRFVDSDVADGDATSKTMYASTSPEFLAFGYGKHAWYVYLSSW
jgi:cytochrome P450